jgi:hypothetical protein
MNINDDPTFFSSNKDDETKTVPSSPSPSILTSTSTTSTLPHYNKGALYKNPCGCGHNHPDTNGETTYPDECFKVKVLDRKAETDGWVCWECKRYYVGVVMMGMLVCEDRGVREDDRLRSYVRKIKKEDVRE